MVMNMDKKTCGFGTNKEELASVVSDALSKKWDREYSEEDSLIALLRTEMPTDIQINARELLPNMPSATDIGLLKPAKEFLIHCRKICEDFLTETEYLANEISDFDEIDRIVLTAECETKANALKFYKEFHLKEKLKQRIAEAKRLNLPIEPCMELMKLLVETEFHIITMKNKVYGYTDIKDISELKEKLCLPDLEETAAEEFYHLFCYENSKKKRGERIQNINNSDKSLEDVREEAQRKIYDAISDCNLERKVFELLPDDSQEMIRQNIYNNSEFYGWKRRIILRINIELILGGCIYRIHAIKNGKNYDEIDSWSEISKLFFSRLEEKAYQDEEFLDALQNEDIANVTCEERLMELAEELLR